LNLVAPDFAHLTVIREVTLLETALAPSDIALPCAWLHPLHSDRQGQWSVSISVNWRVVFEFEGRNVTNVDFVDYH
jgi:proteic killer suppression protein